MFSRFFRSLFGIYDHQWRTDDTIRLEETDEDGTKRHVGRTAFCTCTKCGMPKSFTMMH
jgi:hypothetical protein